MVNALRRQNLQLLLHFPVALFPESAGSTVNRRKIQLIQNGLHRHIAGQIPAEAVFFLSLPEVAEETVKHLMEIEPVDPHLSVQESVQKPVRIEIKKAAVGTKGLTAGIGLKMQGRKGRVQVTQSEIKLIPGIGQNIPCNGELLFFFFLQFMNGIQSSNTFLLIFVF